MALSDTNTLIEKPWPWWRWAVTGLSALALVLSFVLSWHYLIGGTMIGCSGGSSCEQVLNSRWSTIAGIVPISGLAAGAYMALVVASLCIGPATEASVRRLAWSTMLILVGCAAGSAVWFTFIQKWFIGAFCPYCMTTHITGLILATLIIWQAPRQVDDSTHVTPRRIIGRLPAIGLTLVGLSLAGVMATSQVLMRPPAVYVDGQSQEVLPTVDHQAVPMVGDANAEYVVTLLFDYKCPHCQKIHFMLDEVIRRYNGKLAFALCPAPLSRQCNPYIPQDVEQYQDACDLVKIGLAVWLAEHKAFSEFENWMFSFESGDRWQPRSFDAAQAKAIELVGQASFDTAWANPWIDQYLEISVEIYGKTIQSGKGGVPKMVFGSRWVIPEPYNADDLEAILQDSLGIEH